MTFSINSTSLLSFEALKAFRSSAGSDLKNKFVLQYEVVQMWLNDSLQNIKDLFYEYLHMKK